MCERARYQCYCETDLLSYEDSEQTAGDMSGFLCEHLATLLFIPASLHYFVFFFVFVFADRPRYQVRSACHLHTILCSAKIILCTCLRIRKIFTVMATVQAQSLRNEKRYIVFLIASAGWFPTLNSFIYYPVISLVARDLRTTIANVNLTVTSYLAVSGVHTSFCRRCRPTYWVDAHFTSLR